MFVKSVKRTIGFIFLSLSLFVFQFLPFSINPSRYYFSSNYYLTNGLSESNDWEDGIPYYYVFDRRSDDVSGVFEGLIKGIEEFQGFLYVRVKKSHGGKYVDQVLDLKTGEISSSTQPLLIDPETFFHSRIKTNLIWGWGYWVLVFGLWLILKFFFKKC